ncbi:MAG: Rrf2 family transcriptional regulator [Calditrichaceae bacterium]|nr:Rrf2 family transcriptional regulator [Calditrichaceae bacterium]MBN2709851.1 Rrf2 family transcriptional regulator [Calditrichaceae bacterium]RQV94203.1 MAG: Rrf2 family transcriptional regulator [Calditrichota bacterium]
MLRLSKKIEYALISILEVEKHANLEPVSAKFISRRYNIPGELLGKVLQTLVRNNILNSVQGVKGGYALSRSLGEISMLDVMEAIDGPVALTACIDGDFNNCDQYPSCNIRVSMEVVQNDLEIFFAGISMQDLKTKSNNIFIISEMDKLKSANKKNLFREKIN